MNILDNLQKIKEIDSGGMLETEEKFYLQLLDARKIAVEADLEKLKGANFKGIAFSGMGGSGFTGDIIKALIKDDIDIPVEVVKGYNLPCFIKKGWLVIPISYSGNTEETISTTNQALERECEVVGICSGGELEKICVNNNKTVIKIPSGMQPRGAIGYLFFPAYLMLNNLGIINVSEEDIEEALGLIKEKAELYRRETETDKNPAKKLALQISDNLPIVYGQEGILGAVAYRLKCEINENSKTPCWCNEFPELNHNETVGWERLKGVTGKFIILILRDEDESSRIKARIDITSGLIKDNVSTIVDIPVEGKSKLAKALSGIYLGDITSVYLALLFEVNPTPVEKIESLKAELKKIK
ncbi:MAG: bifunctional phosphoglucose/phosphomannose isomerase [Actinomycetota bacterium]|nr:bifunctional phosphoglucose/phosphomannose isomerase [Actinomycetota bacterium]